MSRSSHARSAVFADTHVFVAVLNADDEDHAAAVKALAEAVMGGRMLVTSDWVLAEVLSICARRPLRRAATEAVIQLRSSPTTRVVPAHREDWDDAFKLFAARKDKEWSLVDCASMVICRRLKIRDVLSADHHFAQAGFRLLIR